MNDEIIDSTRHWLTRAVIGLNLCPFAKAVYVKDQIRYAVSEARTFEDVLADIETELKHLADSDPEKTDTTLLIVPHALADFSDYNDALHLADTLLKQLRLEGELQIARADRDFVCDVRRPDDGWWIGYVSSLENGPKGQTGRYLVRSRPRRIGDTQGDPGESLDRNTALLKLPDARPVAGEILGAVRS